MPYDMSRTSEPLRFELFDVPFINFIDHYLPWRPTEYDIQVGLAKIQEYVIDGRLSLGDDDKRFGQFSRIAELLKTTNITGRTSGISYQDFLENESRLEFQSKIDACFQLSEEPLLQRVSTSTSAVVAEYKVRNTDENIVENYNQLMDAVSLIMANDPCRHFMYGITIEDSNIRVWHFSRSHSAMCTSFDFYREPKLFVKIFLSFLFSSRTELGYDPSIHRFWDPKERIYNYVYEVGSTSQETHYFATRGIIYEGGSYELDGRGTRVWIVEEVNNPQDCITKHTPSTYNVLKDVWLEDGSLSEQEIQSNIFHDIDGFWKEYKTEKSSSGSVPQKIAEKFNGVDPEIWSAILGHLEHGTYKDYFMDILYNDKKQSEWLKSCCEGSWSVTCVKQLLHSEATKVAEQEFRPKLQHRIIYRDVLTALYSAPDWVSSFQAAQDATLALTFMYLGGWLHRDVSAGNILLRDAKVSGYKPLGILSDLENAKRFEGNTLQGDFKIRNPLFMAIEMHLDMVIEDNTKYPVIKNLFEPIQYPPKKPLIHNFLHDLESIWWVLVWIIIGRVSAPGKEFPHRLYYVLFVQGPQPNSSVRKYIFEGYFYPEINLVDFPQPRGDLQKVINVLDHLRIALLGLYKSIEREAFTAYAYPHAYVLLGLKNILSLDLCHLKLRTLVPDEVQPILKRRLSDSLQNTDENEEDGYGDGCSVEGNNTKRVRLA